MIQLGGRRIQHGFGYGDDEVAAPSTWQRVERRSNDCVQTEQWWWALDQVAVVADQLSPSPNFASASRPPAFCAFACRIGLLSALSHTHSACLRFTEVVGCKSRCVAPCWHCHEGQKVRRRRLPSNARPEPPVRAADGSLSSLGRRAGSRSPSKLATSGGLFYAAAHGRARGRHSRSLRTGACSSGHEKRAPLFAACRVHVRASSALSHMCSGPGTCLTASAALHA